MELNDFVANFADLFDDTEASEIQANTKFPDLGMARLSRARS